MASPSRAPTVVPTDEPPKIELTINSDPTEKKAEPSTTISPRLSRKNSDAINSPNWSEVEEDIYERPRPERPIRRAHHRRAYSPSPVRIYNAPRPITITTMLSASSHLLENVAKYDGIADLPFPARSSVYMTTFPFTDRDVKKWSWLFAAGVEQEFLTERRARRGNDDSDSDLDAYRGRGVHVIRDRRRNRSPEYIPGVVDIPSIYLSRALDTSVIPDEQKNVQYFIVVQNSKWSERAKLLVAESRKAAGILMYYEALSGHSISFVGAVIGATPKKMRKFRKIDGVEEAKTAAEEGVVGVIC